MGAVRDRDQALPMTTTETTATTPYELNRTWADAFNAGDLPGIMSFYEPDAVVTCGERMGDDAIVAPNPVVVVEVLSPSTRAVDTGAKLTDYFRVPSIRHYLILRTDRRVVVHHRRLEDGGIETRLVAAGPIRLDPPSIAVAAEGVFGAGSPPGR